MIVPNAIAIILKPAANGQDSLFDTFDMVAAFIVKKTLIMQDTKKVFVFILYWLVVRDL